MTACASTPGPRPVAARAAPPARPGQPETKVYFYPAQGQSEAQQESDRYECYNSYVRQTSFDPSRHLPPRELRATVVPAPSKEQSISAASAVGAVIGAIACDRGDTAQGAVIGAIAAPHWARSPPAPKRARRAASSGTVCRGYGRYEKEAADPARHVRLPGRPRLFGEVRSS